MVKRHTIEWWHVKCPVNRSWNHEGPVWASFRIPGFSHARNAHVTDSWVTMNVKVSYGFIRILTFHAMLISYDHYATILSGFWWVWYAQLEIDVDLNIAFHRFHMASYSDPWQKYPMPSTVKECGRSFLCTSLRINLQLDSGYSRYIQGSLVRNCLVKQKSLGKSKKVPATTSTCVPHLRKDQLRQACPGTPIRKVWLRRISGSQKHGYSLSSGILRIGCWIRRNWGCGTGCLNQVQSVCKATFWLPSWHSASIPRVLFGQLFNTTCGTRPIAHGFPGEISNWPALEAVCFWSFLHGSSETLPNCFPLRAWARQSCHVYWYSFLSNTQNLELSCLIEPYDAKTVQRISIPLIHVRVFKARVRSLLLFCFFSAHRTSLKWWNMKSAIVSFSDLRWPEMTWVKWFFADPPPTPPPFARWTKRENGKNRSAWPWEDLGCLG